jgi:hypothetical protein
MSLPQICAAQPAGVDDGRGRHGHVGVTALTLSIGTVVFIQQLQLEREAANQYLWLSYLSQARAERMSW